MKSFRVRFRLFIAWNIRTVVFPSHFCLLVIFLLLIIMLSVISTPLRVLQTSLNRWFLTRVWMTASLLKSPGLFSVFWLISAVLEFGWSQFVLLFPMSSRPCTNLLVAVPIAPITIDIIHIYQPLCSGRIWHEVNF